MFEGLSEVSDLAATADVLSHSAGAAGRRTAAWLAVAATAKVDPTDWAVRISLALTAVRFSSDDTGSLLLLAARVLDPVLRDSVGSGADIDLGDLEELNNARSRIARLLSDNSAIGMKPPPRFDGRSVWG
jgi:hypothetical protein